MSGDLECSFFIPIRRDPNLSDGDLHAPEAWQWLDAVLFSAFGGRTIAPGFYDGIYIDPDTREPVPDASRRYLVAVPTQDVPQLLAIACTVFQQKCIYLSVGGRVEFIGANDVGPAE
jgi:hypothetical protein